MVSFKMFRRNASTDVDIRSPEEKALVRRLDMFLMTFGCLSQGGLRYRVLSKLEISKTDTCQLSNISINRISTMPTYLA